MIANHIHDALAQVRQLREMLLEKRRFRGFSGGARLAGGLAALAAATVLSRPDFPENPWLHLAGWSAVLVFGLLCNYGALLFWFCRDPEADREWLKLMPAWDAIPALAVGAALSLALVLHGQFQLLFGAWMCLYGLAHMGYRLALPGSNYAVGLFYLICGAACWLAPQISFLNPWPMGLVFFAGETAGGWILYRHRQPEVAS